MTLDWPNKSDDVVKQQVETITQVAENIAKKYDLEALVEGPAGAAGGTLVMCIGLKDKILPTE